MKKMIPVLVLSTAILCLFCSGPVIVSASEGYSVELHESESGWYLTWRIRETASVPEKVSVYNEYFVEGVKTQGVTMTYESSMFESDPKDGYRYFSTAQANVYFNPEWSCVLRVRLQAVGGDELGLAEAICVVESGIVINEPTYDGKNASISWSYPVKHPRFIEYIYRLVKTSGGSETEISYGTTKYESLSSTLEAGSYAFSVAPGPLWNYNGTEMLLPVTKNFTVPNPATQKPAAPTGLVSNAKTSDSISLSWNAVKVEGKTVKYKVYRSNSKSGQYTLISDTITATTYTDKNLTPYTAYSYRVTAVVGDNESDRSSSVTVTTNLAVPTLVVSSRTSTSLTLTWNKVDGATKYIIYRKDSNNKDIEAGETVYTNWEDTNLEPNKNYVYTVQAINTGNRSDQSASVTGLTKLTVPANLQAKTTSSTEIRLSWSAVSGATGYNIYRNGSKVANNAKELTYTDTGLSPNTSYSYTVKAVIETSGKRINESNTSGAVKASTWPLGPSDFKAEPVSSTSIKLSWTPVDGAVSYDIYRYNSLSRTFVTIKTKLTQTTYTDESLSSDTEYFYQVKAFFKTGETDVVKAKATTRMAAPTGLAAQALTSKSVKLTWTPLNNATGYDVYRSEDGTDFQFVKTVSNASFTDEGLKPGTKYWYRIIAKKSSPANESEKSKAVNVTTLKADEPPEKPTGLTVVNETGDSVSVKWDKSTDADSYRISIHKKGGEEGKPIDTEMVSHVFEGLEADTEYVITLVAVNEKGESDPATLDVHTTSEHGRVSLIALKAEEITTSTVKLSWNAVENAVSYRLTREEGGRTQQIFTGSATEYTDKDLQPGTAYVYQVAAFDAGGEELAVSDPFLTNTVNPGTATRERFPVILLIPISVAVLAFLFLIITVIRRKKAVTLPEPDPEPAATESKPFIRVAHRQEAVRRKSI